MRNFQAELVLVSVIYLAKLDGSALSQVLLGSPSILRSFHLFTKNKTLLTFFFPVPLSPIFPVGVFSSSEYPQGSQLVNLTSVWPGQFLSLKYWKSFSLKVQFTKPHLFQTAGSAFTGGKRSSLIFGCKEDGPWTLWNNRPWQYFLQVLQAEKLTLVQTLSSRSCGSPVWEIWSHRNLLIPKFECVFY